MIMQDRRRPRIVRASLFILVILFVFGYGWLNRVAVLQGVADLWIVSDTIEDADAVVVLGGGIDTRPFAAADLYNAGTVKLVLVTAAKLSQIEESQLIPSQTELNRAVLIKRGVLPQAIIVVGHDVSNTYEESRAVREWAQHTGAKKIIIVTEAFPSRRVRWIFERELAALGAKVIVCALPEPKYNHKSWWLEERGIISFQYEVLKYLYYRLRY